MGHLSRAISVSFCDENIGRVGITIDTMRSVVRRQLVGSAAAAMVVVAAAALVALSSGRPVDHSGAARMSRRVQQPTFVALQAHIIVAAKREIELP